VFNPKNCYLANPKIVTLQTQNCYLETLKIVTKLMGWNQDPGTGTNLLRILDPDPQHCLTVLCVAAGEWRHPETEKDQEGES
jgi:hypothetical protein